MMPLAANDYQQIERKKHIGYLKKKKLFILHSLISSSILFLGMILLLLSLLREAQHSLR